MIPSISRLHGAELVRDGGSVGATFADNEGALHWFIFPVERVADPGDGSSRRVGFSLPVLVNRSTGLEFSMPWASARDLVARLEDFATTDSDRTWLNVMSQIAHGEGSPLVDCPELKGTLISQVHLRSSP